MASPTPYSVNPPNAPGYPNPPYPGQPEHSTAPQNDGDGAPTGESNYYPPPPQPRGYPPPASQPAGYGMSQPIISQPTATISPGFGAADGWMVLPAQISAYCPPGLQYLTTIDHLFVKQEIELLEVLLDYETNNKYIIKNNEGSTVFYAVEDTDCCTRFCYGPLRDFDIKILDNSQNEVIHLKRYFRCCPCCLNELHVYAPPGHLIGTVEQKYRVCFPEFDIKNERGRTVLKIEVPVCTCICIAADFKVLTKDKSAVVGKVSKHWSGLVTEMFTDADFFGISFPIDLDCRMKAVMLGACFLIDFMYFERQNNPVGGNCCFWFAAANSLD